MEETGNNEMDTQERESQGPSGEESDGKGEPVPDPSTQAGHDGQVNSPVMEAEVHEEEEEEEKPKPDHDEEMVTSIMVENGLLNGVSYVHRRKETLPQWEAAQSSSSSGGQEEAAIGTVNVPNFGSGMMVPTSRYAIQRKFSAATNSSVACAKSWWHSLQAAFSSFGSSILATRSGPLWTARISTEYTSDDRQVTDSSEVQNFPSRDAAEAYVRHWNEQVQNEGSTIQYVVEIFPQDEDGDEAKV